MLCTPVPLSRRGLLAGGASLFVWSRLPRPALAAGARDPRLLVVILRGAMDGLSAVAPIGDPAYLALREKIALTADGDRTGLPLDGFFVLHPSLPTFARLYKEGHAALVHAVASPYRERSHFDGQDVLESGLPGVASRIESGWLNRALQVLPAGERVAPRRGLGVGAGVPLILRGLAPVMGWAPQAVTSAGDDIAMRALDLYTHTDPALAALLREGLDTDTLARKGGLSGDAAKMQGGPLSPKGMAQAAGGAATLLAADDGPRIAALSFDGWDTHAQEGGVKGRLASLLTGLDAAFAALESGLKPVWSDTTVLVITEFGRTAHVNGTDGTDHGTGTIAFLLGGAIRGGRILGDWPGLKPEQLHERRDLRPTTDLRSVAKGLLAEQFGLEPAVLAKAVFPGSETVPPLRGLVA